MNRRSDLLPEKTVNWLASMMTECADGLAKNPVPLGPCLVYDRAAMEQSLDQPAPRSRGEELDDWASMLLKYGLPVLSITRSEWASQTKAQAYIVPTVVDQSLAQWIVNRAESDTRFLLVGEASRLPEELRRRLGIAMEPEMMTSSLPTAAVVVEPELASRIGTRGLVVNQRRRSLGRSPEWNTLIEALDGPVLAQHGRLACWIWETPEWGTPFELNLTIQTIQSPQTFIAVAEVVQPEGWDQALVRWTGQDWQRPACFLGWRDRDGIVTVLLGNLETGITGNSQNCLKGQLRVNRQTHSLARRTALPAGRVKPDDSRFMISLGSHKSCLIRLDPVERRG